MTFGNGPVVLVVAPDPPAERGYAVTDMLGCMPNSGILFLAAVLEQKGYDCITLDHQHSEISPLQLAAEIAAKQPSLVGFTLYDITVETTRHTLSVLRLVYDGPIVIGGYTPTFHAEDILREWPEVDYIIIREGETALVALLEHLQDKRPIDDVPNLIYREGTGIHRNAEKALEEITKLPWMRRSFPHTGDVTPIISRRGCYSRCAFCSMVPFYDTRLGAQVRVRPPVDVVEEIEFCLEHGSTEFMFYDDDFGLSTKHDRDWCLQFLEEVGKRGLHFHFGIELRVADLIRGEPIVRELCNIGLAHISLGMESMLPRQLKLYNKGFQQQDIIRAIEIAKTMPLDFQTNVIFWDPWSTLDEAVEHVDLLNRIEIQDQLGSANYPLFANVLLARRGTRIHATLTEMNLLRLRPGSFCEYTYDFFDPLVTAFHNEAHNGFLSRVRKVPRPPALWRSIPRIERGGDKELGGALRGYAKAVAHAEFDYFRELVTAASRAKPPDFPRIAQEMEQEFGPRVDACATLLPDAVSASAV
jgi:radical SAM superfamily enzyme YgiQ (UPF0313 family)